MNDEPRMSDDMKDGDPFTPADRKESAEPRQGHTYDPAQPIPQHMVPKQPDALPHKPLKDFDSNRSVDVLKIAAFSGWGALLGMFVGMFVYKMWGWPLMPSLLGGFALGWLIPFVTATIFTGAMGNAASTIYMPTGATTPGDRQYSLAQSYVVRGRFEQAAAEYALAAQQYPEDPEPCMRLARLYRDDLRRYDEAILWFKRASEVPGVPPATDMMAMREMIEVYTHKLQQPVAALPYLAKLAAKHPGTPTGSWAKRHLTELKAELHADPS
ncbi:MAG: tetratricopeptide repeat protein [Longimicrobiales bacterium]